MYQNKTDRLVILTMYSLTGPVLHDRRIVYGSGVPTIIPRIGEEIIYDLDNKVTRLRVTNVIYVFGPTEDVIKIIMRNSND